MAIRGPWPGEIWFGERRGFGTVTEQQVVERTVGIPGLFDPVRYATPPMGTMVTLPPAGALLDDLAEQITELEHRITMLEAEIVELKKEKVMPYRTHPKFGRYILVTG